MGKLLVGAVLVYLGYRLARRAFLATLPPSPDVRGTLDAERDGGYRVIEGGEMVACHACATFVPQDRAQRGTVQGERVYFCSEACRVQVGVPQ